MYVILFKKSGNVLDSNPNDYENSPKYNPGEFSSWWKVWLSHLVLLVKLALKNKMHNTIRLETQNKRAHQSAQGQLDCEWTSYELLVHFQIRMCVYWVMRALFLYGSREGHKPQSLIKPPHQATSNRIERGQLGLFPLNFPKLKFCIVLILNLII